MFFSVAGIAIALMGTIFTLATIVFGSTDDVGKVEHEDGEKKKTRAQKQKRVSSIGMLIIVVGSVLQIIGLFN